MKEYNIEVNGKKAYYRYSGDGPCIVLLHGIPTHSGLWDGVTPYLRKHYSIYAFDLLGFGRSDKPDSSEINVKSQADFFIEAFNKMGLKDITVVGHDIGGAVAQIMAISNPGMFKSMILMDSACYDSWPIELLSVESNVKMLFEHLPPDVIYDLFTKYIKNGLYYKDRAGDIVEKYWGFVKGDDGIKAFLRAVESFDNRYTIEVSRMLHTIRMPVAVVWGRNDPYIKLSYAYRLHEDIRNSLIEIVENAGHFVPEDQPERVSQIIDGFMEHQELFQN